MDNKMMEAIADVLKQLKAECMQARVNPTDESIRALMHKYNMLFLGEKLNTIYSLELCHALKETFGIAVDEDELTKSIPELCAMLNMKCQPMVAVKDIGNSSPPITQYSIELH